MRLLQALVDLGDDVLAVIDVPVIEEDFDVSVADPLGLEPTTEIGHPRLVGAGVTQKKVFQLSLFVERGPVWAYRR